MDHGRYNGASLLGPEGHRREEPRLGRRLRVRARHRARRRGSAQRRAARASPSASAQPRSPPDMIYSRIVGTGSYLPPTHRHQRRTRQAPRDPRRVDPRRAPASASATSRTSRRRRATSALEASPRARSRPRGWRPDDIDLIIVATSTPDYVFPSTACLLQAKLGINGLRGVRRAGGVQRLRLRARDGRQVHPRRARTSARWWSAPKCSRASSTGTTAAPACCSATAPARWCCSADETPGIHRHVAARRRQPRGHPVGAGQRLRRQASSASPFLQMDGQPGVQVRGAACSTRPRARRVGQARHHARGRRLADPAPGQRAHSRRRPRSDSACRARRWS